MFDERASFFPEYYFEYESVKITLIEESIV